VHQRPEGGEAGAFEWLRGQFGVRLDELMVEALVVRQLSPAVIGCAADIAINAFNAGDLTLLFLRAGLKPESGYGKSALVSNGITAAVRAADRGDRGARVGLNEFVRLVAERVAPRAPDDLIEEGTAFWRLREATRSDGFDLKAEYSPDERARLVGARFLPLDEPEAPLSDEVTALEDEFIELGLDVALNHYRQAVKNFVDQDFEAANGQLRTMFEAVVVHFAESLGFDHVKAGAGGNAIAYLITEEHLPERDGGTFIRGLWWIVQTNGPHPGTTTAGEVHFRMLTMTGAARYLIDRFSRDDQ
jgi:hypothetical protein